MVIAVTRLVYVCQAYNFCLADINIKNNFHANSYESQMVRIKFDWIMTHALLFPKHGTQHVRTWCDKAV